MPHRKKNGSYYTPEFLSRFIFKHVRNALNDSKSVRLLEPSAGDGSFIKSFNQTKFTASISNFQFDIVEKIKKELTKAQINSKISTRSNVKFNFKQIDFLDIVLNCSSKYDLILGNPPYIKKSYLSKSQIVKCKKIGAAAGLKGQVKNIWTSFLLGSCQLLKDTGTVAFVLPAELLQVNFSKEVRHYLTNNFERLEIFTFEDLLFECKGQDTILLFAYKKHVQPGEYFTHINDLTQLSSNQFSLVQNNGLTITETKWTHHSLLEDDLIFLHNIKSGIKTIDQFCHAKPGIVTAANNFFIVTEETEKKYKLTKFLKPIIQNGSFVNGSIDFSRTEYRNLLSEGKPAKLLCLTDKDALDLPTTVKKYLSKGVDQGLPAGYKCSRRENWFVVPNISTIPTGFFFRRVHNYPKLLKNTAKVFVTDSAYKFDMITPFTINNLIFSFYNSLTLTFCELNGRYYGGTVLELTPLEFKKLPIPYIELTDKAFAEFQINFEQKDLIEDVLEIYDTKILNDHLKLSTEDSDRIKAVRKKLLYKRFR
jgi:adenine-specific DNA-methyltransferase